MYYTLVRSHALGGCPQCRDYTPVVPSHRRGQEALPCGRDYVLHSICKRGFLSIQHSFGLNQRIEHWNSLARCK